ncbi:unnamed protein product [Brassicogethes aeneus]|uniref:Calponin-homology (CH) domain-containing protein n=1 Tax=Brassicogethes aeneus TaxID=1431903 RepID=A0A9P0BDH1_BRAAE|nr:unnamed protein product [Brassicogethes aeneus]
MASMIMCKLFLDVYKSNWYSKKINLSDSQEVSVSKRTLNLDNINLCLNVLKSQHVSGVESVSAQELKDGKLKAILALFYALSRHRHAKVRAQQQEMTPNRYATQYTRSHIYCLPSKPQLEFY